MFKRTEDMEMVLQAIKSTKSFYYIVSILFEV